MSVIIIGAGIAGLSAAYKLLEMAYPDVTILEASNCVGGLSRSVIHDDFIYDLGPHQVHTDQEVVIDFLNKLLGNDLIISQKRASQRFFGQYISYPMGLNDILFGLPFSTALTCFLDFCKQSVRNFFVKQNKDNFESWVISHFGKKMYDIYFGPYTEKVWGKHPSQLAASCAQERIAVQNLLDVLLSALSRNVVKFRKHYHLPHSPYQRQFYYPKYGIGQIADTMANYITAKGGQIHLTAKAVDVRKNSKGYTVLIDERTQLDAHSIISTIPVNCLKDILNDRRIGGKPSHELRFRSMAFVFIAVKKENLTGYHWIYFPEKDCIYQRVAEFKNFSSAMVPAGYTSVCAEIACDCGDRVWNMEDRDLYEKVILQMETDQYLAKKYVSGYWVYRAKDVYPTFDLAYADKLRVTNNYINKFRNVYSIGRQGTFRYINIDEVMLMAFKTAGKVLRSL